MKRQVLVLVMTLLLGLAPAVAQMPSGEFIEAKGATTAVILAHGRAQGPDGQVVGPLRRAIAKGAGMHTLSLQMPVLATPDYLAYAATYPDAYKTLQSAIAFLSKEKGVKRIYVVGYSMGARMTTAYLATQPAPEVVGYIGIGVLEGGGELLDANLNIKKLTVPVIDLYADATPLDLLSAENRKTLMGDRYKQVQIRGANHSFRGYDGALEEATIAWLKEREQKQ
jgi:pimeloyl-ACP methyl ester carboxylesterase